jgi:hypothetical protein
MAALEIEDSCLGVCGELHRIRVVETGRRQQARTALIELLVQLGHGDPLRADTKHGLAVGVRQWPACRVRWAVSEDGWQRPVGLKLPALDECVEQRPGIASANPLAVSGGCAR